MVIVKIACAQPERARVQPAGALRTPCRTALNRRHVQCLRALVCAVTASHMPHLQSPLESGAVGFAPPSTETVRVTDHVRTCTWQDLAQQEQANAELQAFCSASIRGLGLESFKPLLLKGAVASWPAVDKWSLDWLVEHYGEQRVQVRAAPSMRFAYVEPRLMRTYLRFKSPHQAPSMLAPMTLKEFAMRAQQDSPDSPLFYPHGEFYYMQSPVTRDMRRSGDLDFEQPPFSAVLAPDENGERKIVPAATARLWISPRGAVSPLHFDCHDSFLIQMRGTKRMLLWSPDQLHRIYPYRNWHILRRRGKVDPVKPDFKKYPKFAKAHAMEVVLQPGDVLFFPGYWAHYTESSSFSVSITCRFGLAEEVCKRRSWFSLLVRP